jgi:hypothetical protein
LYARLRGLLSDEWSEGSPPASAVWTERFIQHLPFAIGRTAGNDPSIGLTDDPACWWLFPNQSKISRKHAVIRWEGGRYLLKCYGSNGADVNGACWPFSFSLCSSFSFVLLALKDCVAIIIFTPLVLLLPLLPSPPPPPRQAHRVWRGGCSTHPLHPAPRAPVCIFSPASPALPCPPCRPSSPSQAKAKAVSAGGVCSRGGGCGGPALCRLPALLHPV